MCDDCVSSCVKVLMIESTEFSGGLPGFSGNGGLSAGPGAGGGVISQIIG